MSNEIIKQDDVVNAPSLVAEDVSVKDIILPRLSLLQGLSGPVKAKQADAGTWHSEILAENYGATVEFIPVKIQHGAVLFRRGEGMVCKSNDGISSIYGDNCKSCPHGAYHLAAWKDNKRPECSSTLDLVVLERKSGVPMVATFKISTYKTGKLIATNMKLRGACSVILGSQLGGDNYAPTIQGYGKITADELARAKALREQLNSSEFKVADEQESEPRDPGSDDFSPEDIL